MVAAQLRHAETIHEVWVAMRFAAAPLGASAIALRLPEGRPSEPWSYESARFAERSRALRARFSLAVERPGERCIELGWSDGRTHVDRDTELAVELLCRHVADAVERIGPRSEGRAAVPVAGLRRAG